MLIVPASTDRRCSTARPARTGQSPPQKVLGRKIARALWRGIGKPAEMRYIRVAVRGTTGLERWTAMDMYYHYTQLEGRWVGDPNRPDPVR